VSNALGRLFLVSNGYNNSTAYSYDSMGRPQTTYYMLPSVCCSSSNQVTAQVAYDYGGRPTQITYPDGRVITESWNAASHLQSVVYSKWNTTSVNYNYLSSATYWPDGASNTQGLGNGVSETYNRNKRLQPIEILAALGSNNLFHKQICYGPTNDPAAPFCTVAGGNNNGNITRIVDALNNNNTQFFAYDTLNRLATFANVGNTMQQTYAIDPWGNLSQSGTMSSVLTFGTNNRITTSGYGYDGAGNLNSFYNGVSTSTYVYDAEDRINNINSGADTYVYGANGDRVRKNVSGGWTEYTYFGGQPIAEKNSSGTWTDYIFAGGQRIAMAASNDQSNPSATTNYYTSDQIGSARLITNGAGGVLSTYIFYPFGQGVQPDENHYLFSGKERDSESGLDNFGARYLTSTMGRFMSPDSFGGHYTDPQTLNLYAYVKNNPLRFTDPTGHDLQEVCAQTKNNKATCGGSGKEKHVGTTDDKGKFHVTHFQTDSSGNLAGHSVSFNSGGIHIDGNEGEFIAGTDPTRVNGESGTAWSSTHFVANNDCGGTCEAGGAIFGSAKDLSNLVHTQLVGPNKGLDGAGDHEGEQWRGGNKDGPDMHLSFILGQNFDSMHFDNRYPYGSVGGFLDHAAGWMNPEGHIHVPLPKDITPVPQP
jgi:RHS repeat-associated protein